MLRACASLIFLFIGFDLVIKPLIFSPFTGKYTYSYIKHAGCIISHPNKEYQQMDAAGATTDLVNNGYWCRSEEKVKQWISDHAG